MSVYVGAFGLSEDRVYALAAIVVVVGALVWFAATVLRGQSDRLMPGLFVGAAIFVWGLNAIDPDALVARFNLARATADSRFDIEYHVARSADAVPALLSGARGLGAPRCEQLVTGLTTRWALQSDQAPDWRAWNRARSRARRELRGNPEELVRQSCGP